MQSLGYVCVFVSVCDCNMVVTNSVVCVKIDLNGGCLQIAGFTCHGWYSYLLNVSCQ